MHIRLSSRMAGDELRRCSHLLKCWTLNVDTFPASPSCLAGSGTMNERAVRLDSKCCEVELEDGLFFRHVLEGNISLLSVSK